METILDILKLTKKDNCGKCGFPTCMAFAAAVHTGAITKDRCPFIELSAQENLNASSKPIEDPETALAKELKSKVKNIDLSERAAALGAKVEETANGPALKLTYLGKPVLISHKSVFFEDGSELETRDQILLYNYLFFGGKGELSGNYVGLESFPNSISKVVTLKKYTEDKISAAFSGKTAELLKRAKALGAEEVTTCHADVCFEIFILPKVPVQIHFWDHDPEDGFPANTKVLFDEKALDFLDIESLIFAAERLAETLTYNY